MKIKKIMLYGQGNARDHVTHLELLKTPEIEVVSLIRKENALMQKCKNVYLIINLDEAMEFAKKFKPDLIVVSNRADLVSGVSNKFLEKGYNVFGVSKEAAELENSKKFAKELMKKYNIPTPKYYIANNSFEAVNYLNDNWNNSANGYVLKVEQYSKCSFDRTAVPKSLEEAISCVYRLFTSTPTAKIIIEEKLLGYELSLHLFVKGNKYCIMPMTQDYKKLYPNDEGPMTAGVASVACNNSCSNELLNEIEKSIIQPSLKAFISEGIDYNSILYIGIMVSNEKPYVLEYNTRSGNPEWLAILGLLKQPMYKVYDEFYNGNLNNINNFWKDEISLVIYGLSAGYPETVRYHMNEEIAYIENLKKDIDIFGEAIIVKDEKYYPTAGRVLALRKVGKDFNKIKNDIIENFGIIKMNGLYYRDDITLVKR